MGNEDTYFTEGPGRLFGDLVEPARRGADDQFLVPGMTRCLRKQIRQRGGPVGLAKLARVAGVGAGAGRLVMPCSPDELELALQDHRRQGLREGRDPIAASEVEVVVREWARLQQDGASPRTMDDLYVDWCSAQVNALFLSRIEAKLPCGDPADRVERILHLEDGLRERLQGADADVIASISRDPTGSSMRARPPRSAATTAELMNVPIPVLRLEVDPEGHNADEGASVSLQLHHRA